MAQETTLTAAQMAARLSKVAGKRVTAKQVRSWFRENVSRFDDGRYTAHRYTAAEQRRVIAAWTAKGERSEAQTERPVPPKRVKGTRSQVTADAVAESVEAVE